MRAWMREAGYCADPHTAVAPRGRRKGDARSGRADGRAVDRASGEISRRGRRPPAECAPALPDWLGDLPTGASASQCCRRTRRRSRNSWRRPRGRRGKEQRHERRSHASSVRPVGRDRPHAASGNRLARRLGRRGQPRRKRRTSTAFRICLSTWRSRAPSAAPRARSPRRSRRSAAISMRRPASKRTAYFARVLKADVPLALDVLSDILSDPTFDPEELRREQNVIVQEIGAAEDAPDDLVFDRLQEIAFPEAAGRPLDPRHARDACARSIRRACAPIWRAIIARPTWWSRLPARSITRRSSPKSRSASPASPVRRRRRRSRRNSAAARGSKRATSSRCISRWRCKACR